MHIPVQVLCMLCFVGSGEIQGGVSIDVYFHLYKDFVGGDALVWRDEV